MCPTLTMGSSFFVSSTRNTLLHIYQLLPYVLSTSFSTHPKPLTWDKKPFQSRRVHFFRHWDFPPFFRHCETDFFPKFFYCSSHQFLIFCNRMDVQKIPSIAPFTFFGTMRLTGNFKKIFERKVRKFFFSIFSFLRAFVVSSGFHFRVFLSLRYGADLGRSRLVIHTCGGYGKGGFWVSVYVFSVKPNCANVVLKLQGNDWQYRLRSNRPLFVAGENELLNGKSFAEERRRREIFEN